MSDDRVTVSQLSNLISLSFPIRLLTDSYPLLCYLQIYFKNQVAPPGQGHPLHLPLSDVLAIVIDSFTSATERHIEVSNLIPRVHLIFWVHTP